MAKISIGRRLVRATAVAIPMGMLLYVVGAMAATAAPGVFPTTIPGIMATAGVGSAIAVELSADLAAKEADEADK